MGCHRDVGCLFCGSFNIKNKKCQNCGSRVYDKEFDQMTKSKIKFLRQYYALDKDTTDEDIKKTCKNCLGSDIFDVSKAQNELTKALKNNLPKYRKKQYNIFTMAMNLVKRGYLSIDDFNNLDFTDKKDDR